MKKTKPSLFLFLIFVFLFTGCRAVPAMKSGDSAPVTVVTSFYPLYVTALRVAGGVPGVTVRNLTPMDTGCLHDYALTTADMKTLEDADILIINGGGMETFLLRIASEYPDLLLANASEGLSFLTSSEAEHGPDGGEVPNPHVWMSPSNAIVQLENITETLIALDPENAERYRENADAYETELSQLLAEMKEALVPFEGEHIMTFHEAFSYFGPEFGLQVTAISEHDHEGGVSPSEIAEAVSFVRKNGLRALFYEAQYASKAVELVANETGLPAYPLDAAAVRSGERDEAAYLDAQRRNVESLVKGLS